MALNPMAQAYIDRGMTAYSETLTDERLADLDATCTDKHGNLDTTMKMSLMRQEYFGGSAMNLDNQYAELEAKSWEVGDARDYAAGYAKALEFGGNDSDLEKYGLDGSVVLNTYEDKTGWDETRKGINEQLAELTGNDPVTIAEREKLEAQKAEMQDLIKLQQGDASKFGAQYEQITAQMELNKAESELNSAIANGWSDDDINKLTEAWAEKKVSYFDKYESKEMGNPQNAADAKALQDYNKFIDSLRGDKPAEAETAAPEKTEPAKTEPEVKETVTETKTVETKEYNAKPEPEETGEVKEMTEAEKKAYIEETERMMGEDGNLTVNSADDAKRAQERMRNYAQYKEDLGIVDEKETKASETKAPNPYEIPADFKGTQEEWTAQVNKEAAAAVINGDYGNGADRIAALEAAGYNPSAVQSVVNVEMDKINAEKQATEAAKVKEQLASSNTEKPSDEPEYPKLIESEKDHAGNVSKAYDMGDGSIRVQHYKGDTLSKLITTNEEKGTVKVQDYDNTGTLRNLSYTEYDKSGNVTKESITEFDENGVKTSREVFDGNTYRTQTFDKDGNVISDVKETVAERAAKEAEAHGFGDSSRNFEEISREEISRETKTIERKGIEDETNPEIKLERNMEPVETEKPTEKESQKPAMVSANGIDMTVDDTFNPRVDVPKFDPYVDIDRNNGKVDIKPTSLKLENQPESSLQIDVDPTSLQASESDYNGSPITGEDIANKMAIDTSRFDAAIAMDVPTEEKEAQAEGLSK